MTDTELKCRNAKEAAKKLSTASANDKNKALLLIAEELKSNKDYILRENDKDMKAAEENGLPKVLLDRLLLSPDRIDGMAKGVIEVADLPDPVGKTLSDITRPLYLRLAPTSRPMRLRFALNRATAPCFAAAGRRYTRTPQYLM